MIRCVVCHRVRRKALPAKYCGSACKQVAKRRRNKARIEEAERVEREQAERERAAQVELERARAEAERQREERARADAGRKNQELLARIEFDAEQRRQTERAEAERKAREATRIFPPCECGHGFWKVRWERAGLLAPKKRMRVCKKCFASQELPINLICPACQSDTMFSINEFGDVRCEMCRHTFKIKPT